MGGYVDESNAVTLGPEVYCPGGQIRVCRLMIRFLSQICMW